MKKTYRIEVDCPNCAAKMEAAVGRLKDVDEVSVNFLTQKLTVETRGDIEALLPQIVKVCKKVEPDFALLS